MSYEEFVVAVQEGLQHKLGGSVHVLRHRFERNNGGMKEAICILPRGSCVSPALYLDEYYVRHREGASLEEVLLHMLAAYQECAAFPFSPDKFQSWEQVRGCVGIKLIDAARNCRFLERVPHRRCLDLAMVYYVYFEAEGRPSGSAVIRHETLTAWGIAEWELIRQAERNREGTFAPEVRVMSELVTDIICGELERSGIKPGEALGEMRRWLADRSEAPVLYVATNRLRFLGASAVLAPGVLRKLAREISCETLYMIPSSVHEMILMPDDGVLTPKELQRILHDINEHSVDEEERLSDSLYRYSSKMDALRCLGAEEDAREEIWYPLCGH